MADLPSISIIVPNFNGGKTVAATLRSLVDQKYPSLEILVVDGGSTDNSVEIIRQFESSIRWWVSEKDRGQSHAINKGLTRATGEIVNWLCSDDQLAPGALQFIGEQFTADPRLEVLIGACREIRPDANHPDALGRAKVALPHPDAISNIPLVNNIGQSATFFKRKLIIDRISPVDESLHYAMDFDLWCRFRAKGAKWKMVNQVLSMAWMDGNNKMSTGGSKIAQEFERVYCRYGPREIIPLATMYRWLIYPLDRWRGRSPSSFREFLVKGGKLIIFLFLAPFFGGFNRVRKMNWSAYV